MVSANPGLLPLSLFCASSLAMISFYGAGYSLTPAYEADLFGAKDVGPIHGYMMSAVGTAALVGPLLITLQRSSALRSALQSLAERVDADAFARKFGAPIEQLEQLIEAKTVTINALLDILPPGTVDPTPFLYNQTMYSAAAILSMAAIANLVIKPVDRRHFVTPTSATQVDLKPLVIEKSSTNNSTAIGSNKERSPLDEEDQRYKAR
jgi:hypothetical protein